MNVSLQRAFRARCALVGIVVPLLVAACGGDDGGGSDAGAGKGGASAGGSGGQGGGGGTIAAGGRGGASGSDGGAGGASGSGASAGASGGTGGTAGASAGGAGGAAGVGGTGGGDACDPQPPPSFTTNYVTDPGFENGAAQWRASTGDGVFAVTTSRFHCGTHSGTLTGRTATSDGFLYVSLPSASGLYTVSLWVMQNGASNLQIGAQGLGVCSDSTMGFGAVSATVARNAWTRMTGTIDVPSGCTLASLLVTQTSGSQFPDLFVDDVYFVK